MSPHPLADGLIHELASCDSISGTYVPIVIDCPHGTIDNDGGATEHIIIFQFWVSQEPSEEGTLHGDGGAETGFPHCVYRGAVTVVVLSIRRIRTPITDTAQYT